MKAILFDFVRITDENHKHFGKTGQLTDFDTIDGEYVLHFDKLANILGSSKETIRHYYETSQMLKEFYEWVLSQKECR